MMSNLAKRIVILCRERGIPDAARHKRMATLYGVQSVHDLSDEQAEDMIQLLLAVPVTRPPEPEETPDERCAGLPPHTPAPRVRGD